MSEVSVKLPDGSQRTFAKNTSYADVAASIGAGLARAALAVKANGQCQDMTRTLEGDTELEILTSKNSEGLEVLRHSAAHVLAMAVQRLWPAHRSL